MKYLKEREFVKKAHDYLKEEITASRIILLESGSDKTGLTYVMYEDRFGRQFQINKYGSEYSKKEYFPKTN